MPLMNSSDSPLSLEIHQFIAATQPLNSLAFVFDGVNFGAADFAYSAYSLASFTESSSTCLRKFLSEITLLTLLIMFFRFWWRLQALYLCFFSPKAMASSGFGLL